MFTLTLVALRMCPPTEHLLRRFHCACWSFHVTFRQHVINMILAGHAYFYFLFSAIVFQISRENLSFWQLVHFLFSTTVSKLVERINF